MTSWKIYKLGDICTLNYGKALTATNRVAGDIPVYSSAGITGSHNVALVQSKGIIVGRKGTVGTVYYSDKPFYCIDTAYYILPDDEKYDFKWLYYRLKSLHLDKLNEDSAVPGLNRETAYAQEFPLPSLEEQRRIAGILGAIDDKIENNRRINTNLELQAQALFEEWISKSKTSKGVFDDIIQTTLAGDWGQETIQGNYTHEVFCIRGADIPALQNGDKGKMPIRYILEKNYKTKQLRANDLVIEISGGSPTQSTGRICMITQSLLDRLGKDVVCTNFCRAITPKNGYAIYIYLYWQMLYNKNTMFSYENGTTGIKNLNIADLISKEPIEIPAQEDVEKLNIVLQPIFDQIYANGLQNETIATLRDTLLPKLMNGEIKL